MLELARGHGRGTWRPVRSGAGARLTCPRCGCDFEIPHEIAADGTVRSSVVCIGTACEFHERVRLKDWHRSENATIA